jgi:hypothetical protein
VTGNTISGRVVWRRELQVFQWHSIVVDRKSMGHTVAERSWKDADFVCISVFSAAVMQKC